MAKRTPSRQRSRPARAKGWDEVIALIPQLQALDARMHREGFSRAGLPSVRRARDGSLTLRAVWRRYLGATNEAHSISFAGVPSAGAMA